MDLRDGRNNVPAGPAEQVFFDKNTPTTVGVVFDPNTPNTTDTLYVSSTNGSTWIYNGSAYVTYTAPAVQSTPFFLTGTAIDAGSNKTASIQRSGEVRIINSTLARFRVNSGTREILIASDAALNPSITSVGQDFVVGTTDARDLIFKTNSVERIRAASGGAIRFNSAYTFPTADGTAGQALKTNGAGVLSFGDVSVSVPQANKIYVDSVNGVDSTGRGNINNPYLTPEYALADITNTGTVTATTTNASATLTAVSSTTNIVIGQFITGAGIPYNSVVVSKTVDTIVLSQVCTASATITATWWTVYELVLNGNFTWVSNWFKQGFVFNFGTSNINFSGVVFTSTAAMVVPWLVKGGNWNGTNTTSKILSISQSSVATLLFEPISFISVGTSYSIDCNQNGVSKFGQLTINCDRYRCLFGWVGDFESTGIVNLNGNFYGLLGVVRLRYPRFNTTGTLECPSSVYAILDMASAGGVYNVNSDIRGSIDTKQSYGTISGRIVGTTVTTAMNNTNGDAFVFNGSIIATTINVNGYARFNGMTRGNVVHTTLDLYLTEHMGNITGSGTDTTCTVWGSSGAGLTLGTVAITGTYTLNIMDTRYMVNGLTSLNIGSGCTVNNYGYYRGSVTCSGTLNNTGRMLLFYRVLCAGTIKNNNFISIDNGNGNENIGGSPCIALDGTGKYIQNGGVLHILRADSLSGAIRKTATGQKIQLLNQAYIRVTNGLAPIQIISNSGTAQDVEVYSVIDNCAVGFRISDTFSDTTYGTAYAPNILVGGTMLEDTTYLL